MNFGFFIILFILILGLSFIAIFTKNTRNSFLSFITIISAISVIFLFHNAYILALISLIYMGVIIKILNPVIIKRQETKKEKLLTVRQNIIISSILLVIFLIITYTLGFNTILKENQPLSITQGWKFISENSKAMLFLLFFMLSIISIAVAILSRQEKRDTEIDVTDIQLEIKEDI